MSKVGETEQHVAELVARCIRGDERRLIQFPYCTATVDIPLRNGLYYGIQTRDRACPSIGSHHARLTFCAGRAPCEDANARVHIRRGNPFVGSRPFPGHRSRAPCPVDSVTACIAQPHDIFSCCSLLPSGLDRRRPCALAPSVSGIGRPRIARAVFCSIAVFATLWTLPAVHASEHPPS